MSKAIGLGCPCPTLNGVAENIEKWISTPKVVTIYETLAGKAWRKSTPNGYIGKVYGTNTAGTWIQLSDGRWIMNDPSYTFAERLTQFQRDDYAKNVSSKPREKTLETAKEVQQAVDAKMNIDPFGFENIVKKYGLQALLIAGGIYLVSTFGKTFIEAKLSK